MASTWTDRSGRFVRHIVVPATRRAVVTAGKIVLMPYVAPAGLMCASLLLTLGVIYGPFGGSSSSTARESKDAAATPTLTDSIAVVERSKPALAASTENLQLKKIANELDAQLLAQDSTDDAGAMDDGDLAAEQVAVRADRTPSSMNEEPEAGSFTEPWSRKKPSRPVEVARAELETEEDFAGTEATDEEMISEERREEELLRHHATQRPSQRTAERPRTYPADLEDEGDADLEAPQPRRTSRFAQEAPETEEIDAGRYTSTMTPTNTSTTEATAEEVVREEPINPWRRIRKERLERESTREDLVGKTDAPKAKGKAQYRSPPGQDIELDQEWVPETATRSRGETKRTSPR